MGRRGEGATWERAQEDQELGDEAFAAISLKADSDGKPPLAMSPTASDEAAVTTRVLCIPLRDQADEAASHMLAQLLVAEGFDVVTEGAKSLADGFVLGGQAGIAAEKNRMPARLDDQRRPQRRVPVLEAAAREVL